MERFVGDIERWYDQMLSVPPPKVMALIKMARRSPTSPAWRGGPEEESEPAADRHVGLCGLSGGVGSRGCADHPLWGVGDLRVFPWASSSRLATCCSWGCRPIFCCGNG
jgi:hypothetical protein